MKKNICLLSIILIFGAILVSCNQSKESQSNSASEKESIFTKLTGSYLGQTPPGEIPELFAPGIISTGLSEGKISFSADGREVYFGMYTGEPLRIISSFYSCIKNSFWIQPEGFPFVKDIRVNYYFISEDGEKAFYDARNPVDNIKYLYFVDKTGDKWGVPQKIDFSVKGFKLTSITYPSNVSSGNLYLQIHPGGSGSADIYMSENKSGNYSIPVKLSSAVNSSSHDCHPFIAQDESYLIFDRYVKDGGGYGEVDLYISFRDKNGEWTKAQNMGPKINTEFSDRRAFVTFDGKYLFFASDRRNETQITAKSKNAEELQKLVYGPGNGHEDVYWMDAGLIEELQPEHLKQGRK